MKFRWIAPLLTLLVVSAIAEEPAGLRTAKAADEKAGATEDARAEYLLKLAALRRKLADANNPQWKAVDAEVMRHPVPKTADSKALTALLIGKWSSPRHDYAYRKDGSWIMLPAEEDATHGTWRIEGNRFYNSASVEKEKPKPYTILLLARGEFAFTDGEVIFYEKRMK